MWLFQNSISPSMYYSSGQGWLNVCLPGYLLWSRGKIVPLFLLQHASIPSHALLPFHSLSALINLFSWVCSKWIETCLEAFYRLFRFLSIYHMVLLLLRLLSLVLLLPALMLLMMLAGTVHERIAFDVCCVVLCCLVLLQQHNQDYSLRSATEIPE